jgi:hypothetical protein
MHQDLRAPYKPRFPWLFAATVCFIMLSTAITPAAADGKAAAKTYTIAETIDVGRAFSGLPVGFALRTHGQHQFVAYYNAKRKMVVASRKLGEDQWTKVKLPETFPWDSHNDITLAIDDKGLIHLSGNLHVDPLNYYRTTRPLDIGSLQQVNRMVGQDEDRATYPRFLRDSQGRLLFMYRDGSSGNGRRLINIYDSDKRQWHRWLDEPLLDGQGKMNAYPRGPQRGPDGWFHLAWVWRNTPDAQTNHDLSYMVSRDLKHWFTGDGQPVDLPATPANEKVIVDPVPSRAGLLNASFDLGFDHKNRPVLAYHKYDEQGHSQIYNARLEGDDWRIYQTSDFDFRWDFGGRGALPGPIMRAKGVRVLDDGRLVQSYRTPHGSGTWLLDPKTLKPKGKARVGYRIPRPLGRTKSEFPGMGVRWHDDAGEAPNRRVVYKLRHETLGRNRDRKRTGQLPDNAMLQLYKFVKPAG